MRRWKLAVFDWNGTLLNDLPIVYDSVIEIFKRYGLPAPTLEEYRSEIKADFMKFYHAHGMPAEVTGDDLNKIRKEYLTAHRSESTLQNSTLTMLFSCKNAGLSRAIVSAQVPELLSQELVRFGIANVFDNVRGGAWPKKEEALLEVMKKFDVRPYEAFYVDDTFDGIASAKNVGMATFGYTGGYNPRPRILEANPNWVIDDLSEIVPILRKEDG